MSICMPVFLHVHVLKTKGYMYMYSNLKFYVQLLEL